MKLRVLPEASLLLVEIASNYELKHEGLGDRFIEAYDAAVQRVVENPRAWRLMYGDFRGARIARFPYRIIYLPLDDEIQVYTIFALRSDPARLSRDLEASGE